MSIFMKHVILPGAFTLGGAQHDRAGFEKEKITRLFHPNIQKLQVPYALN